MKLLLSYAAIADFALAFLAAQSVLADTASESTALATNDNDSKKRYIMKYSKQVTLDNVGQTIEAAGALVERQLTCTRGVVINVDQEGRRIMEEAEGFSLTPLANTHASVAPEGLNPAKYLRERSLGGYCSRCPRAYRNYILTSADIKVIKDLIKENIALDSESFAGSVTNSLGELLRLVFHDASSYDSSKNTLSGLNGCVNMDFDSNAGLQDGLTFLAETKAKLNFFISNADLFVLAAISAVEAAGGPVIPYSYGRTDGECSCEKDFFPDPESDAATTTDELNSSILDRLGLSERDITALLGAHTLGKTEEKFSGYKGGWIPPDQRSTFDNLFYFVMINRPWVKTVRVVAGKTFTEWRSPLVEIDAIMLNTDAILGFEIHDGCNVFGDDPENFLGTGGPDGGPADFVPDEIRNCTKREDKYGRSAHAFADDNEEWIEAFTDAFYQLSTTTVPCGRKELRCPTGLACPEGWEADSDDNGGDDHHNNKPPRGGGGGGGGGGRGGGGRGGGGRGGGGRGGGQFSRLDQP